MEIIKNEIYPNELSSQSTKDIEAPPHPATITPDTDIDMLEVQKQVGKKLGKRK